MGKTKRRASPSAPDGDGSVIEQARAGAEAALKGFQKRLPADLVKQVEKTVDQGQKTVQSGLKAIQAQLKTTARKADVDKLTKRVDAIAKQLERMVGGRPTPPRSAIPTAKKAAPTKLAATRAGASKAGMAKAPEAAKAAKNAEPKPTSETSTSEG